jgi:hypothetical protein
MLKPFQRGARKSKFTIRTLRISMRQELQLRSIDSPAIVHLRVSSWRVDSLVGTQCQAKHCQSHTFIGRNRDIGR